LAALGFDFVFDTGVALVDCIDKAADELLIDNDNVILNSICPAFVTYIQKKRPELTSLLSKVPPISHFISIHIANRLKEHGVARDDLYIVSVVNCLARKDDVDAVLTAREFQELIRKSAIDVAALPTKPFDEVELSVLNELLTPGGFLMETVRVAAAKLVTWQRVPHSVFQKLSGPAAQKIAELPWKPDWVTNVTAIHGLASANKFLDLVKAKDPSVHDMKLAEILACPHGCVAGGGGLRLANFSRLEHLYEPKGIATNRTIEETLIFHTRYNHMIHDMDRGTARWANAFGVLAMAHSTVQEVGKYLSPATDVAGVKLAFTQLKTATCQARAAHSEFLGLVHKVMASAEAFNAELRSATNKGRARVKAIQAQLLKVPKEEFEAMQDEVCIGVVAFRDILQRMEAHLDKWGGVQAQMEWAVTQLEKAMGFLDATVDRLYAAAPQAEEVLSRSNSK
jgi:hypothetical protein